MKIEMGESLGFSWLKHVKKCQIVQTNWKPSPCWEIKHGKEEEVAFYEKLKQSFKDFIVFGEKGLDIFKKNSGLEQVIRQTECDVVGCSFGETPSFYMLESAFHENGLGYGSKRDNVAKVISKLARIALAFYCYLGEKRAEIAFASPKVSDGIVEGFENARKLLQKIFDEEGFEFKFKLYFNDAFVSEIASAVYKEKDNVSDANELYMRSIQLFDMAKPVEKSDNETKEQEQKEECQEDPKVAEIVRKELIPILQSQSFSVNELKDFLDKEYTKGIFKLSYPLLSVEHNNRYYANPVLLKGEKYYLCSQWFQRNIGALRNWIEAHTEH